MGRKDTKTENNVMEMKPESLRQVSGGKLTDATKLGLIKLISDGKRNGYSMDIVLEVFTRGFPDNEDRREAVQFVKDNWSWVTTERTAEVQPR